MKGLKDKLRRAVSMTLAAAMTLSMFSVAGFSGAAKAAQDPLPRANSSADASGDSQKPKLFIDFLGDTTDKFTGQTLPMDQDQSFEQSGGPWYKYGDPGITGNNVTPTVPGTVFWVGVGIDKMTLFELARDGKGLTSLELGFYYNPDFVMPYVGGDATAVGSYDYKSQTAAAGYKALLEEKNLGGNAVNQWAEGVYHIEQAIPYRSCVIDPDTQETVGYPSDYNSWEMLYVSLEKNEDVWAQPSRFSDPAALDDGTTYYVMMLPFVLKQYDPQDRLCFRLSRNASLFSMGGGEYGAGTYDESNFRSSFGAWEKETRTPNHNLKEMFVFEGDLNIFAGRNESDDLYKADLNLSHPGAGDSAKLYPTADPDVWVDADQTAPNATITGLSAGTEMTVEVTKGGPNITASVTVTDGSGNILDLTPEGSTGNTEKYSFTMPTSNVTVEVKYIENITDADNYSVKLVVVDPDSKPDNQTRIKGVDSDGNTHATNVSGESIKVKPGNQADEEDRVEVHVDKHPDYGAQVSVTTKYGSVIPLSGPDENGNYTFTMPTADVTVTVTYHKLKTYYAELAVDKDLTGGGSLDNLARLSFVDYQFNDAGQKQSVTLDGKVGGHDELKPIPEGRLVTLDIALAAGYAVADIQLWDKISETGTQDDYVFNRSLLPLSELNPPDGSFDRTVSFVMPDNNVEVYVIFAKAENHTAKLELVGGKSAEMEGNKDGSDGSAAAVLEKTDMTATPKKDTIQVQTGNKVTVTLDPDPGYEVESIKVTSTNLVHPDVPFKWDTATGLVTFVMPGENVTVTVTFKEIPKDKYNATLIPTPNNVGAFYIPTTGWPTNPAAVPDRTNPPAISYPTKYNNEAGDRLTAWVDVEPGWYIASVRVVGKDSSNEGDGSGSGAGYPLLSQSGNGYNNGAGGVVVLEMNQPAENITVYVDLKKGPPPVEPEQSLTLRVEDPDNTAAPAADNWAQMTVAGNPSPHVTKDNNDYTVSPVAAGEPVEVTFNAAPGYYVADVKVTPETYGVVPQWTVEAGKPVVKFQQPAGSATVTVRFAKKPADMEPPHKATLYIVNAQAGETAKLTNTTTTTPPNFTDVSGGSVAAWPVDIFTTEVQTGRFVTVDVYQGGSVIPWQGTDGNGQFVMPTGDASVYVTFSDTELVGKALTLTAYGPDGEAVGTAGSASMTVDGAAVGSVKSNESPVPTLRTRAEEGQQIEVTATANSGYVVDHISYTINGTVTPAELPAPAAGSRKVRFAMPASATGVEVFFRKGEAAKYMANITLWPPAGSTAAQAGDARFDANNGYSISVVPGTGLVVNAHANDGYYISKIEITPANLGLGGPITGVFATQTVNFVMPAANCVVNVFFEKAWPDEAQINATLRVHGPDNVAGNHARMFNDPQGTSTAQLTAGGNETITALNQELMKVKVAADPNYKLVKPITIQDSAGNPVSYWWSGSDEISFRMPNTMVTVDVFFEEGTDDTDLKATLYNDNSGGSAFIEHNGVTATDQLTGLRPGDQVNISATPNDPTMMPVVWVATEPSQTVISVQPLTQTGNTYTTSFVMQEEDAGVHIEYVTIPDVTNQEYLATLIATEINGTANAGKAKMEDTVGHATAEISTVNAASMPARADTTVTITATPETGYVVDSVVVDNGAVSVTQTGTNTYTYTMPDRAVTAVVTFKPWSVEDNVLKAQVIVNNGGEAGNKALLRRAAETPADGVVLLQPLAPADQVMVDLTVAPGYKVNLILIQPTQGPVVNYSKMTLPANQSQTVHFFMPTDDVIVYVEFVEGGAKYDISMIVEDMTYQLTGDTTPPSDPYNTATLHTDYSGTTNPPSKHGDPAVTVRGAVNDVVTIETQPRPGYYAVVTAVSDDINEIPVTNLTVSPDGTTFTFSVPNNNVKTVVRFYPKEIEQQKYKVRLHIVNPQFGNLNSTYARQKDTILNCTDAAGNPAVMEIEVPYLKEVSVGALALPGKYIQSAYAQYQGLMLPKMNEVNIPALGTGPLTERAFDFKMQNGDVDVYIVFTDVEPKPYTLGLTVKGPAGEPVGAAGSAVLTNMVSGVSTAVVPSNKTYDPVADTVLANATDTFEVRIKVNAGYEIDTVTVTPLSLYLNATSITQDATTKEWIYTYSMPVPPSDLTVNVVLKASDVGKHKVTLYLEDGWLSEPGNENKTAADSPNYEKGTVTYSVYQLKHHGETMMVPETELVTIDVAPADGYYVHHAYAVTKQGEVLPLKEYDPSTISNLQKLGMPNEETAGSAKFVMPKEDVDVYIGFRNEVTDPPTGDYSAVLTVFDPTNSGSSSVRMDLTRPAGQPGSDSVTAVSDGVTTRAISVNQGETLTLTLTIAPGYGLDSITVTGGPANSVTVTQDSSNSNRYTFTMPAHDVGVIVKLKTEEVKYTATLHIVDHSSALGNAAAMQAEGGTAVVNTDGGKLTDLEGDALIHTTATPQSGVIVRAVIATDSTGSHYLPVNAGKYDYTMNNENVDITVVFDNIDPKTPDMYIAIVEKAGEGTNLPGNTASITNNTNPALVHGSIWTGIYGEDPKQRLQVDVKTENNYYAVITAKTVTGTVLPVLQSGTTGTVQGLLDVPTDIAANILITVTYSTTPPEGEYTLTLKLVDPTADGGNTATVIDKQTGGTNISLGVTGAADTAATTVANAVQLGLTTNTIPGVYEVKRELTANGVTMLLPANGEFFMPLSDAQVTVTLKQGDRTPRPHDNRQDPAFGGTNGTAYIDGYLKGQNLGGNQAKIQVPNLYDGTGTLAAYDPAVDYTYKLYIKDGSAYLPLEQYTDYDEIAYGSYTPDAANTVTAAHTDTGWEFTIRSLKGESALTELLTNGGVLYITATAPGKDESEYVEVTLPADPNKGKIKVTLRIVDNSGVEGNLAQMSDGKTTVTTDGAQITGLQGNELIRTVATPKAPARVSAVTVTDSGGTRLLDRVPENTGRYPYYMIGEDAVITVYFETSEDDELTRYIAAVAKYGAIAVPGNDATIKNDTRDDLLKGVIWAEGHEGNNMRLTVSVAQDYYAHIEAYNKKTGDTIIVTAFGAGPGVTEFDALLAMPAADVQVNVTFTKEPPDNLESSLTLKAINHDNKMENLARLIEKDPANPAAPLTLEASGSPFGSATDTKSNVPAGTKFDLLTAHDQDYYVDKVLVTVYDAANTPISTLTVNLDNNGGSDFTMPLGKTDVEVYFKKTETEPRSPRPYDPANSEDYNAGYVSGGPDDLSDPTQAGWIMATEIDPDAAGRRRIEFLVPTLHDDEETDPTQALSNAGDVPNNGPAAVYKFYWKDSYGGYHSLAEGTPGTAGAVISTTGTAVSNTYTIGSDIYDGYLFTMTALRNENILGYYIKNGGTIYVTATQSPEKESDYTQIIIPRLYTATLKYEPNGDTATMAIPNHPDVSVDGGQTTGLRGTELITVYKITPDTNFVLVGVVAETEAGSVNANKVSNTEYTYTMDHADVTLQVVFAKEDDPFKEKGPHIVTVYKVGDEGLSGNNATVEIVSPGVTIPDSQKGNIWTAAYIDNVVQVNVTTEPGYWAEITAKEKGTNNVVSVLPYVSYGQFTMVDADVDVTVTYHKGKPPAQELKLTTKNTQATAGNSATLAPDGLNAVTINGVDETKRVPDAATKVDPGTKLTLTTTAAADFGVKRAYMKVGEGTNTVEVDIPLTDGVSLPVPVMPMASTEVIVEYERGAKTPRPYDPRHSVAYNSPLYAHNSQTGDYPDLSQTHQEGWILAETRDKNSFKLTIPVLHDSKGPDPKGKLYNAGEMPPLTPPTYQLYWKDSMGAFHPFTAGDIAVTDQTSLQDAYTIGSDTYHSYCFNVTVNIVDMTNKFGTLWNGYTLQQYLANGGSIYVTATGGPNGKTESEKTEVVIPAAKYTATLKYKPGGAGATMSITGFPDVTADGGKTTGLEGTELITVKDITPDVVPNSNPARNYVLVGVVAETESGAVNAEKQSDGSYQYTMVGADVTMRVVFADKDDPFKEKGPHIVTVYKQGDDGLSGNGAAVKVDSVGVVIPDSQKGNIWTAAYVDNTVVVDVTTAPGYHIKEIIAVRKDTNQTFKPYLTPTQARFTMVEADVDVTVVYEKGPIPPQELTLTTSGTDGQTSLVAPPGNTVTLTPKDLTGVTVDGADVTKTPVPADGTKVAPNTPLTLTTTTAPNYSVKRAYMKVDDAVEVEIPLTDGVSLPIPVMPMAPTEVIVEFEEGEKTPRPYDPVHSEAYTVNNEYQHNKTTGDHPDLSQTHQEGWILAQPTGDNTFTLTVPVLHDNKGSDPKGKLYHAGDTPQPAYQLYWKDGMGNFQPFTGADITVSNAATVPNAYTIGSDTYVGYTFDVAVNIVDQTNQFGTLWNGYTLQQYLKDGGSIYITATGGPNGNKESEKTEVVIPSLTKYTATLKYKPGGAGATMSITGFADVTADGGKTTGLSGTEVITVKDITPDTVPGSNPAKNYVLVGVVAETAAGAVNAEKQSDGSYQYTMDHADVTMRVVFTEEDDPFKEKGPHIVTVYKVGDDGLADNSAAVEDVDVPIPADKKGNIWTVAYEGNVVRVNVTAATGYHIEDIVAVRKDNGQTVDVAKFLTHGQLYMVDSDVDVTVTYKKGPPPPHELKLTTKGTGNVPNNGNKAILAPDGMTAVTINGVDDTKRVPDDATLVAPGTKLTLITDTALNPTKYSVKKATMIVGGTVEIDIPLTDGASLPVPEMPMDNAEVVVEFEEGEKTPRPYDPVHSEAYTVNNEYQHNKTTGDHPDLSQTHQEGWILAETKDENSFKLTVPVRHDNKGLDPRGTLYHAGYQDPTQQPTYQLYWKDSMGNFQPLVEGTDIEISNRAFVSDAYTIGSDTYNGYAFDVKVKVGSNGYGTLWNGYTLQQYLANGGSIYITATGVGPTDKESEKTEVVIPAPSYTATLKFLPGGAGATMTTNAPAPIVSVNNDGGQITDLKGTEQLTVKDIVPDADHVIVGVVAETGAGSVNADKVSNTEYTYTMDHADVTLRVVFTEKDDPFQKKGPHIVTVYKVGDDGLPDNGAAVEDVDIAIPDDKKGNIWTVAYEGNTVRVDVTTAQGYYAEITAVRKDNNQTVDVAPFLGYGQFYMVDADVDVTVTYKTGDPPSHELKLTTQGTKNKPGNAATLAPDGMTAVNIGGVDATERVPDDATLVAPGTELTLMTSAEPGYSVEKATMVVNGVVEIDIPLTDGTSLPIPVMPMADTEVVVTFQQGEKTPRPYDPKHSEAYNSPAYQHEKTQNTDIPDLSQTHQEGWILATTGDPQSNKFNIKVPVLHDSKGTYPKGTLYNAGETPPDPQPTYQLYWKDSMGNFQKFTTDDITVSNEKVVSNTYTIGSDVYDGYTFDVEINIVDLVNEYGTLWSGYTLQQYLQNGGSIYITATGGPHGEKESEKTEVVIIVDDGLQPYDPEQVNTATDPTPYEDHWITSENRGDYLIVTVPLLNKKGATDNSAAEDVDKEKHTFQFYLVDDFTSDPNPESWTYQDLADVITLTHPDPDNNPNNDPYENDSYYTDTTIPRDFYGARFILTVKTDEEIEKWVDDEVTAGNIAASDAVASKDRYKELAGKLRLIIDNEGTDRTINGLDLDGDGTAETHYRLYITHTEDDGAGPAYTSPYVDFEVPRYYSLTGQLESYAPQHIAGFTLTDGTEEYISRMKGDTGVGMWRQDFKIKLTSDLDKLNAGQNFTMTIKKAGHVTYTRTQIVLDDVAAQADGQFDPDTLEFKFTDIIRLFAGDVDGNGVVRAQDVDMLYIVLYGPYVWTQEPDDTADPSAWKRSVYNPDSTAYVADLNGDGKVTSQDLDIIYEPYNYGRRARDYGDPQGLGPAVTISLFSLRYQWANDMLLAGKDLPGWVTDLIQAGEIVPSWAVQMLQEEKTIPAWAIELAQKGEDLPEDMEALLTAGEELPETLPEEVPDPVEPEAPNQTGPAPMEPEVPNKPGDPYHIDSDTEIRVPDKTEDPDGEDASSDDSYHIDRDTTLRLPEETEKAVAEEKSGAEDRGDTAPAVPNKVTLSCYHNSSSITACRVPTCPNYSMENSGFFKEFPSKSCKRINTTV